MSGSRATVGLRPAELVVRQDGQEAYRLRGPLELGDAGMSALFRGGRPTSVTVDVT